MKTVMIIAETCKDGVGKHVADLVTHLNKEKYQLIVVHGTRRIDYYFEIMMSRMLGNVVFEPVPTFNRTIHPLDDLRAFIRVSSLIKKYKPEIVHCHSSKAGVIGRFAAIGKSYVEKLFYTPHAYAVQNRELGVFKHYLYLTLERLMSNTNKCLTINVSNGERDFALKNRIVKEANSTVIYNAIEDVIELPVDTRDIIRAELGINNSTIVISCVARLYYQKNPELFISLASKVIQKNSDVVFLWIGEGDMMKYAVESTEHTSQIRFIGHRTDIPRMLEASDIYLSTSRYEGMPYTLIEACRSRLPIVATGIEGNTEVVQNDKNGYLFSIDDEEMALKVLEVLIAQDDRRADMGDCSRKIFDGSFHIHRMVRTIESLYDEAQ